MKAEQEANPKRVDFYRTLDQAEALLDSIPDVPLTYIAAEPVELPSEWPVERMRKFIRAKQSAFVDRFPQGRLVPVKSSHNLDLDQPERDCRGGPDPGWLVLSISGGIVRHRFERMRVIPRARGS